MVASDRSLLERLTSWARAAAQSPSPGKIEVSSASIHSCRARPPRLHFCEASSDHSERGVDATPPPWPRGSPLGPVPMAQNVRSSASVLACCESWKRAAVGARFSAALRAALATASTLRECPVTCIPCPPQSFYSKQKFRLCEHHFHLATGKISERQTKLEGTGKICSLGVGGFLFLLRRHSLFSWLLAACDMLGCSSGQTKWHPAIPDARERLKGDGRIEPLRQT